MKKVLFVLLLACATSVSAAYDAFLKIEGIDGKSTDANHKGWIEVSSLSFGVSHPSTHIGAASDRMNPSQSATIRARSGQWDAQLRQLMASGKHLSKVVADVGPTEYTFQDAMVTDISSSGMGGANPNETTFTLSFGHYAMETTIHHSAPPLDAAPRPSPNIAPAPSNAQVFVNDVPAERFNLLGLSFASEHSGTLKLHEPIGGSFERAFATKAHQKVTVQKEFVKFTLTDCAVTSYVRGADGNSTVGFTFGQYYGPPAGSLR